MLVARILAGVVLVVLGAAIVTFLITKDRRWLRFGGQVLWLGVVILLILLSLFALERFLLVV